MSRAPSRRARLTAALAAALALSGCAGAGGTLARWRMANDKAIAKGPTDEELQDDRSLMARWINPRAPQASPIGRTPPGWTLGPDGWKPPQETPNPEAEAEFAAAEQLFQKGKFAEAEAAFGKIAARRKDTSWGEKALYYLGETQYQRGKYVAAHDTFEKLFAAFPGTRFLEKAVAREYAIAQTWLDATDPEAKPEQKLPWTAHFDGRLPLVDVGGNAEKVLEHVRQHDPTGPLADDAALRIADRYARAGDYESAAFYYDQLIADHPKSPYLQKAYLASIDAKVKDYIGPEYDGGGLEKAAQQIKQTMALFPERKASTDDELYHTLDLINDQMAERTFVVGDYYDRTGKVLSAEYYFGMIPQKWPKSEWAAKAKTRLAALAKRPRTPSLPSKILTQPGSVDPLTGGVGSGGLGSMNSPMGGMGMGP